MEGTNPLTTTEWLTDSSLPFRGNLDPESTMLLLEVLKLHAGQWIHQHISYMFIHCNILELHCSSLHHIHDIVELDLHVVRIVMEHGGFLQLHKTLIVTEDTSHIQLEIK